jgi:hypothetical protein
MQLYDFAFVFRSAPLLQSEILSSFYEIATQYRGYALFAVWYDDSADHPTIEKIDKSFGVTISFDMPNYDRNELSRFVSFQMRKYITVIDNSNFKKLGMSGQNMAVAAGNVRNVDHKVALEKYKDVAVRLVSTIGNSLVLGTLDSAKYSGFLKTYHPEFPCVLILNMKMETFLIVNSTAMVDSEYLSRLLIEASSKNLQMNSIDDHLAHAGFWNKAKQKFDYYYPWSFISCLFCVIIFIANLCVENPRSRKNKIE